MTLLNVFYLMGIGFGIIFLFTNLAVFFGGDSDMDTDGMDASDGGHDGSDGSGSGLLGEALTFRSLFTFLTFFGWTGVFCLEQNYSHLTSIVWAVLAGLGITLILAATMLGFKKLQAVPDDLNETDYVGKQASVYLVIPGKDKAGKIQLQVRGASHTIDAISANGEKIETNSQVTVTDFISDNLVKVAKNK